MLETGDMVELETLEEIRADIAALKIKISKAEDQQAYTSGGPAQGQHMQRGDLTAMYRRLEKREEDFRLLASRQAKNSKTLARFPRPQ